MGKGKGKGYDKGFELKGYFKQKFIAFKNLKKSLILKFKAKN